MAAPFSLSLHLLDLSQDVGQFGVILFASGALAIDAKRSSSSDEGGDDGEGDHCDS